jgi:hypothetical protein
VEALILFALVLVSFQDYGLLFSPRLVCNNWLCTSMDVEAGVCNPLSKKESSHRYFRKSALMGPYHLRFFMVFVEWCYLD